MKKAMDVQFNWVFILIAGAAILIFFGSIVMKMKDLSARSASQDTVMQLEKKFSVSLTQLGKTEEMDFQGKELIISCDEIRSGKASQTISDPLFSPQNVKGAKLITLTKAFYMPFHVTNFLYITSSSVRYILVYDDNEAKELADNIRKDMGDKISVEVIKEDQVGTLKDQGHYKTKIVFVNTSDTASVDLIGDIKAVQITKNANELVFFTGKNMDPEGEDGKSVYLSTDINEYRETILGAIFAENKEAYECSLKRAVKKLNMLSKLYIERTSVLSAPDCDYIQADEDLDHIEEKSSSLLKLGLSSADANILKNDANELEAQNNMLIMNSCPEIY